MTDEKKAEIQKRIQQIKAEQATKEEVRKKVHKEEWRGRNL